MKTFYLMIFLFPILVHGQGTILFNNCTETVRGHIFQADGQHGYEGNAQLYFSQPPGAIFPMAPLFPVTTFHQRNSLFLGCVFPVEVVVPGVAPGETVFVVMRVFPFGSENWETADPNWKGESNFFPIELGGNGRPPALLEGLEAFSVIPEPSSRILFGLGFLGVMLFLCFRRQDEVQD
jgi:hypothetical protein